MATEELTFLLLGIIILVFLVDILIKKRRKSKDIEIEKIEINEKAKKSFLKKFLEKINYKNFFWAYVILFFSPIISGLIENVFYGFLDWDWDFGWIIEYFPRSVFISNIYHWLDVLPILYTLLLIHLLIFTVTGPNKFFNAIKRTLKYLLNKFYSQTKKTKLILLIIICSVFLALFIEENKNHIKEYINWKNKSFSSSWITTDCKNSARIDFLDIKYDDKNLYYNLKRFSDEDGIDDISKVGCSYHNKNIFLYQLEDEDGFVIAEFKPKSFDTKRYLRAEELWPWGEVYRTKNGEGYNAKGSFYISKKSFKKIVRMNIIFNNK